MWKPGRLPGITMMVEVMVGVSNCKPGMISLKCMRTHNMIHYFTVSFLSWLALPLASVILFSMVFSIHGLYDYMNDIKNIMTRCHCYSIIIRCVYVILYHYNDWYHVRSSLPCFQKASKQVSPLPNFRTSITLAVSLPLATCSPRDPMLVGWFRTQNRLEWFERSFKKSSSNIFVQYICK